MIRIIDKQNCCGCSACVQDCPQKCISLEEDEKGFRYPIVNERKCIDCGMCEKVCPILNLGDSCNPIKVFAAYNPNEKIRIKSSSGGVFTLLAETIINSGGVVFGAKFNEKWEVVHDYTETIEGIESFRGSKYVQSIIGNSYMLVKQFLQANRKVLFSGTPCQISGLKHYLRKVYDNLFTVEVICHGVPSPLVWKDYLDVKKGSNEFSHITFRDKRNGWMNYGLSFDFKNPTSINIYNSRFVDLYLKGYYSNVFLRESCYNCKFKNGKSNSDIALGDYWGAEEEHRNLYDDKGLSCIICYSSQGLQLIQSQKLNLEDSSLNKFIKQNPIYYKNNPIPNNRNLFWKNYNKLGVVLAMKKYAKMSFSERVRSSLIMLIYKLGLLKFVKKIVGK